MKKRALFVLTFALLLAMAAAACTVINNLHLPPPPPDEAGAAVDAGGVDADKCVGRDRPPGPPQSTTATTGGDDTKNDILVAVRSFSLFDGDASAGLDVDDLCSCAPDPEPCLGRGNIKNCDEDGGRDNAVAAVFKKVSGLTSYDPVQSANQKIATGVDGYLIGVKSYNGLPNDSEVDVSIYPSLGTMTPLADGGANGPAPFFDARDQWLLDANWIFGSETLHRSLISGEGYVSNNVLVATIPALHFPLLMTESATLKDGLVVGHIVTGADGKPTIANGVLAGRWSTADILLYVGPIAAPNQNGPLCKLSAFGGFAQAEICLAADIPADPSTDRTGAYCDALSLGIAYQAVPAAFGDAVTRAATTDPCSDAGTVTCDSPKP